MRNRRSTHYYYGDGCLAPHGEPCTHESASGIDQTEGPGKVWQCDTCGFCYRVVTEDGITREVPA